MGEKKIKIRYLLLLLFMLFSIFGHSQKAFTEELLWGEKNELSKSMFQAMESFVNEDSYEKLKLPKVVDVCLGDYFWALFTKKKREKNYAEKKQIEQLRVKNILETHFIRRDTIIEFVLLGKNQLQPWLGDFHPSQLRTEEFRINNRNIFILMMDRCPGIYCPHIFVFIEEGEVWKLVTGTYAKLPEMLIIKVEESEDKIVFETTSGKVIGRLPFNVLNSD